MMHIAYVPIFKDTLETTNLSEMVGKVQVEAVVSDVGNRIVAMDEDIYKVRYKYLELIWYLKDTIKIPVFT